MPTWPDLFSGEKFEQEGPSSTLGPEAQTYFAQDQLLSWLCRYLSRGGMARRCQDWKRVFTSRPTLPVKRMCGLQLLRAYAGLQGQQSGGSGARDESALSERSPGPVPHRASLWKLRPSSPCKSSPKWLQLRSGGVRLRLKPTRARGSNDVAISEHRQVLSVNPRWPGIHYPLGRALLARSRQNNMPDDVAAASKEFEQELQLEPGNANAAYELGEIHRNVGEMEQAQKVFEQAGFCGSQFGWRQC